MTTACVLFSSARRMLPVLSSLVKEKSGAGSPTWTVPARAWVHKVSKGMINKTSQGRGDITRAKPSGERYMARHMKPTNTTQRTKTTTRTLAVILIHRRRGLGLCEIGSAGVLMSSKLSCRSGSNKLSSARSGTFSASAECLTLLLLHFRHFDLANHNRRGSSALKHFTAHRYRLPSVGKQLVILAARWSCVRDWPVNRASGRKDHQWRPSLGTRHGALRANRLLQSFGKRTGRVKDVALDGCCLRGLLCRKDRYQQKHRNYQLNCIAEIHVVPFLERQSVLRTTIWRSI